MQTKFSTKELRSFLLILAVFNLTNCTSHDQPQSVSGELTGNWQGVYETRQLGSCTWSGDASVSIKATFQVKDHTITGQLVRNGASKKITGKVDGSNISFNETNSVVCDGVPGIQTARYEGLINGSTLTLASHDTLCPMQGCVFLRTLKLTRQ